MIMILMTASAQLRARLQQTSGAPGATSRGDERHGGVGNVIVSMI